MNSKRNEKIAIVPHPYLPSPLQELFFPTWPGIRVFLKRDELIHPEIQGNKWRKLKPLLPPQSPIPSGIFSFGGPFSNHLHALAAAGVMYGFPTAALIRGTFADLENPTLAFAARCGMKLFPVAKSDYEKLKKAALLDIFDFLEFQPEVPYIRLPEGGDAPEALRSCMEIVAEIKAQLPAVSGQPIFIAVPAGTGCTAAGVIAAAADWARVLVFPAAPYGVDQESIQQKIQAAGLNVQDNFQVFDTQLKFAQMPPELKLFVDQFYENHQIQLDPIYTSKMMFQLEKLLQAGHFPEGSCIIAIHTGGLQGWNSNL